MKARPSNSSYSFQVWGLPVPGGPWIKAIWWVSALHKMSSRFVQHLQVLSLPSDAHAAQHPAAKGPGPTPSKRLEHGTATAGVDLWFAGPCAVAELGATLPRCEKISELRNQPCKRHQILPSSTHSQVRQRWHQPQCSTCQLSHDTRY